ncbi:3'-5' exonuclease domain-containing protein [Aphelenchoides fujianensis]|nr:3'-5' exonuclease domain-containing protein [Aphelenchoides fujianensis]
MSANPQASFRRGYHIPADVKNLMVEDDLTEPFCYQLYSLVMNDGLNPTEKERQMIDLLTSFLAAQEEEELLFDCAVDVLVWANSLREVFAQSHIRRLVHKSVGDLIVKALDQVATGRRLDSTDERLGAFVDARQLEWPLLSAIGFELSKIELFARWFLGGTFGREFCCYVCKQNLEQSAQVVRWLIHWGSHKRLDFPFQPIVYSAFKNNERASLLELLKADEKGELAAHVVDYLDHVIGSVHSNIDPSATAGPWDHRADWFREQSKEVVKLVFSYAREFPALKGKTPNCVFHRRMSAFIHSAGAFRPGISCPEAFYQKASSITRGDQRAGVAGLNFVALNMGRQTAIELACYMDLPRHLWPAELTRSEREIRNAQERIQQMKANAQEEYEDYREAGFTLLQNHVHRVRFVDTREALEQVFKPFMQQPTCQNYGFDMEGEQSYCGDQPSVCLIQMTNKKETLLIDMCKFQPLWSTEEYLEFFRLLFHPDKWIFGFDFDNDLKNLVHSFPELSTQILPNLENLVCLRKTAQAMCADPEAKNVLFGEGRCERQKLAYLAEKVAGLRLNKDEQESAWSHRPLRIKQAQYAAQDSFATYKLAKIWAQKTQEFLPAKFDVLIAPVVWNQGPTAENGARAPNATAAPNGVTPSTTRKTKCTHFTNDELKELLAKINAEFAAAGQTTFPPSHVSYITDTMCAQLGNTLRRVGVDVASGQTVPQIEHHLRGSPSAKVITSGRAVNKFSNRSRVLDIPSASSLDVQLEQLLRHEKLRIDPQRIEPRCVKCNRRDFCVVPFCALQYIHHRMSAARGFEDANRTNVDLLLRDLDRLDGQRAESFGCSVSRGPEGFHLVAPNAVLDLQNLTMTVERDGVQADERVSLKPYTDRSLFEADSTTPRSNAGAFCRHCGKENADYAANRL